MAKNHDNPRLSTQLVHAGSARSSFGEVCEGLFLTQGFAYESAESAKARFLEEEPGFVYSRYSNPTITMFEQRIAAFERAGGARATASGMAAVYVALMAHLRAGDHVIAATALFGSCRYIIETLLPRFGISSTLVDGLNLDNWRAAVQPNSRAFFLETPTNPTLDIIDIAAVAEIAHDCGARLIVDNVFATPYYQSPLEFGADVVVYSATKHIDGHGRCLGGVVLADEDWLAEEVMPFIKHTGPTLSPFNAWTLLKSLESFIPRVERQTRNAEIVADWLATQPKISRLRYPGSKEHPQAALIAKQMRGGSNLIAFEVRGGEPCAFTLLNRLKIIKISNNLGDAKSLITHPATTTHKNIGQEARDELGISDGLLRLSVGLEDPGDLIEDIDHALASVS